MYELLCIFIKLLDMDYIPPPEGPLPEAESLLVDSEDDSSGGLEQTGVGGGGGGNAGGLANSDACGSAAGGVLYSRLRLILQTPEPPEAVNA